MTISSQTRKAGPFVGNDSTTAFPFAFKVFSAADMYVVKTDTDLEVETVLVLNTDYTVSLNADQNANPGGTITLPTALATGFTLTVTSNISPLQQTDLTNQGGFYPSVITNALDKLTILIQQALDSITRSLKLPVSTPSGVSTTLPLPSSNKLIGWNQDADGLQNVDPTTLATIVAFGTANADVFDGDGATTQFNLSANPGALNNLDVSIGGVTQTPGVDYTWSSGTVITFTSAPPVGTGNILVRYMQGLPQGYTDSAASTFIPNGIGASTRSVQDKLRERKTVQDFSVPIDGTTNAATFLVVVANSGLTEIIVNGPVYVNGSVTFPSTLALHFENSGGFIIGPSAAVTINGPIYSNHNPFKYATGTGSLTAAAQTLSVPSAYPTVQRAIDAVPNMLWQDWTVSVTAGTYTEDVRIESKVGGFIKPGSSGTAAGRAQLTITGSTQTAQDPNVKIKSVVVMDCHGGAYHPAIANLTVTGYNAYTNENEAISFYGCSGGAVSKVSFAGTGADKCVMSFGSKITVEGLAFGSGVNNYALVTKHGGEIYGPDVNALNGQLDHTGSVIRSVTWPISGFINVANISKVTCTGYNEWDSTGLRSGLGYFAMERAATGPMFFNEYLSSWQSYFQSTTEFDTFLGAGTTLAYVTDEGTNLQTVNGQSVALWIRRNRSIQLDQKKLAPMQMVVSCYFTSVTGDAIVKIGNKGSASEDGVYFKLTASGLYGGFQAGAGAEVLTSQICTYAQATGKSLVVYIKVLFDGSVIFKVLDSSFNQYKQMLPSGTVNGNTSTYAFHSIASSAVTGTANFYLSEARVARV